MKKKFLPYILGCAMVAVMPFAAHAETFYHIGTDIDGGTATTVPDKSGTPVTAGGHDSPYETYLTSADGPDAHNEFTEHNDQATSKQNTLAKVFTGSTSSTGSELGNKRNTAATTQSNNNNSVTLKNEQQGYRANSIAAGEPTTISDDLGADNFNDQTNDTAGTTDLETSISEFNMTIPAKTVLPIGATHWRIGNVEIDGEYFVRPDKVKVVVTHNDFVHSTDSTQTIAFTVSDNATTDAALDGTKNRYFFQNGGTSKQDHFPYAYTEYTSTGYQSGLVSEIHETHQVWVNIAAGQWVNKSAGKYTGLITFTASTTTDDTETVQDMYTNTYPGEPTT